MSPALQEAFAAAAQLPELEQNQIATKIRKATKSRADSAYWKRQFADSEDVLEMLHDEGIRDYHAGSTLTIDR